MNQTNSQPNRQNILIVDDDPHMLHLLTDRLAQEGYKPRPVTNGRMALITAKQAPPHLILLDIMMPEMDGYEICRRLKEDEATRDIPIIFLSTKKEIKDKLKAFEVGGVDYITNPFEFEELLIRINTHLTLHKLQKKLEERVAKRNAQLTALNTAYEKFVPGEFLNFLQKESVTEVKLGDYVQHETTILFSLIHDFSRLSEQMTPAENFAFINSYLNRVSPFIRQYNGFIDQYTHNGIMALFPQQAIDALHVAIATRQAVSEYNHIRQQKGLPKIAVGSGIHIGKMMLGIIGERARLQGTVIADAVNTAARIQGLNKLYGASIVISQEALQSIDDFTSYNFRFLDKVQVKGKKEPISVFEIFDGDPNYITEMKLKTKSLFEDGLFLYHDQKFAEASVKFDAVLKENPDDKAASLYLQRSARFMVQGVPPDWAGVEILTTK